MKDNKYIRSFNEYQENLNISDVSDSDYSKKYFSLTDKYNELPDELIFPTTKGFDDWLSKTPTHIKLLSILCGLLDANLVKRFQIDNTFFDALNNEYKFIEFELTKNEVIESCLKLKEEGFLE